MCVYADVDLNVCVCGCVSACVFGGAGGAYERTYSRMHTRSRHTTNTHAHSRTHSLSTQETSVIWILEVPGNFLIPFLNSPKSSVPPLVNILKSQYSNTCNA